MIKSPFLCAPSCGAPPGDGFRLLAVLESVLSRRAQKLASPNVLSFRYACDLGIPDANLSVSSRFPSLVGTPSCAAKGTTFAYFAQACRDGDARWRPLWGALEAERVDPMSPKRWAFSSETYAVAARRDAWSEALARLSLKCEETVSEDVAGTLTVRHFAGSFTAARLTDPLFAEFRRSMSQLQEIATLPLDVVDDAARRRGCDVGRWR